MNYLDVPAGKDVPNDINVIIENPMGGSPVKYELDKKSGVIFVDRFLHTPMFYPGNYGFIPHTLSGDGDPVDVIVISPLPVVPGSVLRSRPVGVLLMEDDGGEDEKIVAVPVTKMYPYHSRIQDLDDISQIQRDQIAHFFTHYKDLEPDKWAKIRGWGNADTARELILKGLETAKSKNF
jgi:inorganic pyrophosphatase